MRIKELHRFLILLGIMLLFFRCEKRTDSEMRIAIDKSRLAGTVWLSVDEEGEPKVKDFQKCKLHFLSRQKYEIRNTFVFSESTFRNPGTYEVQDSLIKLKSMNGSEIIGKLYLHHSGKIKIEWNSEGMYGEGKDIFMRKEHVSR